MSVIRVNTNDSVIIVKNLFRISPFNANASNLINIIELLVYYYFDNITKKNGGILQQYTNENGVHQITDSTKNDNIILKSPEH